MENKIIEKQFNELNDFAIDISLEMNRGNQYAELSDEQKDSKSFELAIQLKQLQILELMFTRLDDIANHFNI